jgi:hypothetical protein
MVGIVVLIVGASTGAGVTALTVGVGAIVLTVLLIAGVNLI